MVQSIKSSDKDLRKRVEKKRQPEREVIVTTLAGNGLPGLADGPARMAKFKSPLDVIVAGDGTIYIADGFNSCIRKITHDEVITFAGNGNANIKDGIGKDARFKIPCRLAVDIEGNLYLSDAADPRIRKITSTGLVSTYAGEDRFGFRDGDSSVAQFGQSFGIVADAQKNIYIADSQNDCIRKISSDNRVTTIAGAGSKRSFYGDTSTLRFHFLKSLILDKLGNLFIADFDRICKISPVGFVSRFAGQSANAHAEEISKTIKFSQIEDMVMDEHGNIYLTESHRLLKINPGGSVSVVAGSIPGYQDGSGESALFNAPKGLGIDKQGNIYVADSNNNRIRKISFE